LVRPGDELALVVDIEQLSARGGWAQARASVDDDTACQARMFFAVT
jgi:3-hydroxymyristoyl/3-hydroxydecanoyl-(acyl carrier protein) dehydratase